MKNALIVSNKFNFGHISGIMGWYSMLGSIGMKPMLYCDDAYKEQFQNQNYSFVSDIYELATCDIAVIFNISTKDADLCKQLKERFSNVKIIFIYHEPWRGIYQELSRFKNDYRNLIKQIGRSYFARKVLKLCDLIICPSITGYEYYLSNEYKHNKNCIVFPLVFSDDCKSNYKIDKKYISFISTASRDKAFDHYIEFVKYSSKKDYDLKYQITTQTNISVFLDEELNELINRGRLIVKHGFGISETEMNEAYDNSLVTWLAYRSSTQSGVIGKAFMWGSPCVATKVGVFADIVNGKNGILIQDNENVEEIYKAVCLIKKNSLSFFYNARMTFDEIYNADLKSEQLLEIIKKMGGTLNDYN